MAGKGFVFLVGPMGAGKTTVGRQLASVLGMPFIDTDHLIEERSGADIPWIFDVEGEAGFRDREARALQDVCSGVASVVATGGGIITRDENRELINQSGFTVYLRATLEQQLERTEKDKNRPLLRDGDPVAVLTELIELREPLYRDVADLVYPTDHRNPRSAAADIARAINAE